MTDETAPRLFPFLRTLLRPFWKAAVLAFLCASAASLAGLGLLMTSAWLLATASFQPSIAVLQVAIVGVRFFGLSRGVFRYLERLATHDATFRILSSLRTRIFAILEPRTPAASDRWGAGELLSCLTADVETLENLFTRVLLPPAVALAAFSVFALVAFPVSPLIPLVVTFCALLFDLILPWTVVRLSGGNRIPALQAALAATVTEASEARWELLAYGATQRAFDDAKLAEQRLASAQERWQRAQAALPAFHLAGQALATLSCLALTLSAEPVASPLPAVLALGALAVFESSDPLAQAILHWIRCRTAALRIASLESIPLPTPQVEMSSREPPATLNLTEVGFRFPQGSKEALDAISLRIHCATRREGPPFLQVTGPSGSGKSTLASLLAGLRIPTRGRVSLSEDLFFSSQGAPGTNLLEPFVRLVSRRDHVFAATLRENLTLGAPEASDEELGLVMEMTGLDGLVADLPEGLATHVGDTGRALSGGEKQRVILARALLSPHSLLVLDEALSELDEETAGRVLNRLALRGQATVYVSHVLRKDLSHGTVYLAQGRIVEQGATGSLCEATGPTARLWALQQELLGHETAPTSSGKPVHAERHRPCNRRQ